MDESCVCCACVLTKGVSQRRKLYSQQSCHVLPVLVGLFLKDFCEYDVNNLLPRGPSVVHEERTFVCMKCFRNLEKIIRLQNEKNKLEQAFSLGFHNVAQRVQLRRITCSEIHTATEVESGSAQETNTESILQETNTTSTPQRRKRQKIASPPQPLAKRQRIDTPTRNLMQRIHAPETPSVSVSFI